MKQIYTIAIIALLCAIAACQSPKEPTFFDRLVGKWQIDGRQIVETWQKSKTPDATYTAQVVETFNHQSFVREEITVTQKDGQIYYNAKVKKQNGGKSIPFKLTESSPNKAVFENPQHEYPQKITYTLTDDQTLVTEVSGTMDAEPQSFSFTHHKVK